MSELTGTVYLTFEPYPGQSIDAAAVEATVHASDTNLPVHLKFNGTELIVKPGDTAGTIQQDYDSVRRQDQRRRGIA